MKPMWGRKNKPEEYGQDITRTYMQYLFACGGDIKTMVECCREKDIPLYWFYTQSGIKVKDEIRSYYLKNEDNFNTDREMAEVNGDSDLVEFLDSLEINFNVAEEAIAANDEAEVDLQLLNGDTLTTREFNIYLVAEPAGIYDKAVAILRPEGKFVIEHVSSLGHMAKILTSLAAMDQPSLHNLILITPNIGIKFKDQIESVLRERMSSGASDNIRKIPWASWGVRDDIPSSENLDRRWIERLIPPLPQTIEDADMSDIAEVQRKYLMAVELNRSLTQKVEDLQGITKNIKDTSLVSQTKAINEAVTAAIKDKESEYAPVKQQLKDVSQELDEVKSSLERVNSQFVLATETKTQLETQLKAAEDKLAETEDSLAKISEELSESLAKISELESGVAEDQSELTSKLQATIDELEQHRDDGLTTISELTEEIAKITAQYQEETQKVVELTDKLDSLTIDHQEMETKYDSLYSELVAKEAEINRLNEELVKVNEDAAQLNQKLENQEHELQQKIVELAEKTQAFDTINLELTSKIAEIEAINNEVDGKASELDDKSGKLEEQTDRINTLLDEIKELQGTVDTLTSSMQNLQENIDAKNEELRIKSENFDALDREFTLQKEINQLVETQVSKLDAKLTEKESEIQAKEDEIARLSELLQVKDIEISETQQKIADKNLEISNLSLEMDDRSTAHQDHIDELQGKIDELNSVIQGESSSDVMQAALIEELQLKQEELAETIRVTSETLDSMTANFERVTAEKAELSSKLDDELNKFNSLNVKYDDLTDEMIQLNESFTSLQGELTAKSEELHNTKLELVRVKAISKEETTDKAEIVRLKAEIAGLKANDITDKLLQQLQDSQAEVQVLKSRPAVGAANQELTSINIDSLPYQIINLKVLNMPITFPNFLYGFGPYFNDRGGFAKVILTPAPGLYSNYIETLKSRGWIEINVRSGNFAENFKGVIGSNSNIVVVDLTMENHNFFVGKHTHAYVAHSQYDLNVFGVSGQYISPEDGGGFIQLKETAQIIAIGDVASLSKHYYRFISKWLER
ncbi:hypothetical protein ABGV42_01905 [Paenibacillus pabuli]|uniref:hypothetical protein n=1 Tax=Paenibacillus pabuli TaxID=1472 RepID=UPI003241FF45